MCHIFLHLSGLREEIRGQTERPLISEARIGNVPSGPGATSENHQIKLLRLRLLRFLRDEVLSVCVMRLFLSERQVDSGLSLISQGPLPTLPQATVHSRLPGRCALSTAE